MAFIPAVDGSATVPIAGGKNTSPAKLKEPNVPGERVAPAGLLELITKPTSSLYPSVRPCPGKYQPKSLSLPLPEALTTPQAIFG